MSRFSHAKYRPLLLKLYQAGLQKVRGDVCVSDFFQQNQTERTDCSVLAIGKAAFAMAQAADQYFRDYVRHGLVITKYGHADGNTLPENWQVREAGHPVPDANSLRAGTALIAFLQGLPPDEPVYILISGGASALVEHLPDNISPAQLEAITRWMLANGLDIYELNRVRQQLSLIKGGGALRFFPDELQPEKIMQLLISDVPDDDPAMIGSGLFVPCKNEPDRVRARLPKRFHAILDQCETAPVPGPHIHTHVVASNRLCRAWIARQASKQGLNVMQLPGLLTGDVGTVAKQILQQLEQGEPGLYIWGGEPTVSLPESPGRGGRNQQLALLLAKMIRNDERHLTLCAGTDGTDGPTEVAGALVDATTLWRGEQAGCNAARALAQADAGTFLDASGDLIDTGPTGSNVMDIILALKLDLEN